LFCENINNLRPILASLHDKIKITVKECKSTLFFNDKIKIYASHDIIDGEYFCSIKLFDIHEILIGNISFSGIYKSFYNMKLLFADIHLSVDISHTLKD
jgi:hypothetical protein